MSATIVVRDARGERIYQPDDFPLSLGAGPDADVHLPGLQTQEVLAFLGISEGTPFVQPAQRALPVFWNERLLEASHWLRDGDTIRIETVRITCERMPERLEFRVHRLEPLEGDELPVVVPPPLPPDDVESVAYKPAQALQTPAGRRLRPTTVAIGAFFLRSAGSPGSSSPRRRCA